MTEFLLQIAWETWNIFKQASAFLLFGFLIAGLIAVLVPERLLARLFRKGKVRSVLWASTIGAPLPLCSCGVVPAALALRRQGATPGATVAFLIATPETGADSIALTYALMDPITTVARPVAAVSTAVTAGICTNLLGMRVREGHTGGDGHPPDEPDAHAGHAHEPIFPAPDAHSHDQAADGGRNEARTIPARTLAATRQIYRYAFRQLLDDISYWVLLGIVLSAVVAAALPPAVFEKYLGDELTSMLVMLLIGIPIYVCASEATPVAAALVMKGLNPGAALVFLLAGPATNIGSLVLLSRFLGGRITAVYIASIVVVTLLAGFALNWLYRAWEIDPRATFGAATAFLPEWFKVASALLLIALLAASMRRAPVPPEWIWLRDRLAMLTGLRITTRTSVLATTLLATVLYVGSGLFMVQPGEVGVRMRFGKIIAAQLDPGLHYRLPRPFESHLIVPQDRVQRIAYGFPERPPVIPVGRERSERATIGWDPNPQLKTTTGTWFQKEAGREEPFLLTGDGNLIDLRWTIQYRVKDPVAFAFNIAEPDQLVGAVGLTALRDVVARSGIDAVYTSERSAVEDQVSHYLQRVLDDAQSGVEILAFRLQYVHPPGEVHDSFRDVSSSQEDKLRTINRARIFAVETVNQAKAEAAAMIEQALGLKEQQILRAQGDASAFGLKLNAYKQAPGLTKFRLQVESMEETLPGLQKFVMPGAEEIKDFDMWLLQPLGAGRSSK